MTANDADLTENHLVLGARLSEMDQLPLWVDALAARYGIAERVKFAINLCLEEAISNIIRHGYANSPESHATVRFTMPSVDYYLFTVDDAAPHFNPLELPSLPPVGQQYPMQIGGQGIRLMRGFANKLEYEAIPAGNRLRIGFTNEQSRNTTQ